MDGKVTYLQFLEDSYATAASFRKDGCWIVQTEVLGPSHSRCPTALKNESIDSSLLQLLTTEHFALQTARSATIAEANGRTSLFINAVAAALVATALVGQATSWGPPWWAFMLAVLSVVVFLGL